MAENYEVVYTHPSGATATFIRHEGELDALAKALDSEQFWVFKNVKSLLVRNEAGDLDEANRLMREIGFTPNVRVITRPEAIPALVREPAIETATAEGHGGIHLPGPSYWPLFLALSAAIAFGGLLFYEVTLIVTVIGLVGSFISMVGWGLEPI